MIFAVAALLLYAIPGTEAGLHTVDLHVNSEAPTAAASASADTKGAVNSNVARYNLDSVSFNSNASTNTKDGQSATLTAVSLGDVQNSQSLSSIRIPDAQPGKSIEVMPAERAPARKSWMALSILQHGAASFDAYSTRDAIEKGAVEDDVMMRPFAHSPAIYAAIQVGPVILDILARHMQHSEYIYLRRTWWIPQSVATFGFIFSGFHNLNVSRRL
jgi:hypothetical protein